MKPTTWYAAALTALTCLLPLTPTIAQSNSLLPSTTLQAGWNLQHFGTDVATVDAGGLTNGLVVAIAQVDGTDWHTALVSPSLDLVDGSTYTIYFSAKSSTAMHINYNCTITDGDYHGAGLYSSADLTPTWHKFRCAFTASKTSGHHERFDFLIGTATGSVSIAGVKLVNGSPQSLNDDTASPASWNLDTTGSAHADMVQDGDALKVTTTTADGTNWHVQIYQSGINTVQAQKYILTFEAKADKLVTVPLSVINQTTYASAGLFENINLAPAWQKISYTFTATNPPGQLVRLPDLDLGAQTGTIWIKNATLVPAN